MSNREQFLLDRKKGIGGSDVAAIMGKSSWSTPLDIYNDKLNPIVVEEELDLDLKRGIRVEKYILQEYSENTNEVIETKLPPFIDKEYPFMQGNPDARILGKNVLVEAKSTKAPISMWNEGIPEYYKIQVAYYAMLADAERVDIPVLFNNWTYGCFTYWRDYEFEARIKEAVINFWQNHIVKGIAPAPTTAEELQLAYPNIYNDKTIKADENIREIVSQLQEASTKRKELEKLEQRLKTDIQVYMGDAGLLDAGFCKVSLKNRSANRLNTEALKIDNPAIYQSYLSESNYRVLQFVGG
jgi:putative phage-type endonuclease